VVGHALIAGGDGPCVAVLLGCVQQYALLEGQSKADKCCQNEMRVLSMLWGVRVLVQCIVCLYWVVDSMQTAWVGHFGARSYASLTDMGSTL